MDLHMDPAAGENHLEAHTVSAGSKLEGQCFVQQQSESAADVAGEQQQQLTHTVQSGLEAIASRKQDIHAKVMLHFNVVSIRRATKGAYLADCQLA